MKAAEEREKQEETEWKRRWNKDVEKVEEKRKKGKGNRRVEKEK